MNYTNKSAEINVFRGHELTIIDLPDRSIAFDSAQSKKMKPFICVCTFMPEKEFLDILSVSGIVRIDLSSIKVSNTKAYISVSFFVIPTGGFSNASFESLICDLVGIWGR